MYALTGLRTLPEWYTSGATCIHVSQQNYHSMALKVFITYAMKYNQSK